MAGGKDSTVRMKDLERDWKELARAARPFVAAKRGEAFVAKVEARAREELERIVPRMPFIGGKANRLDWNLRITAIPLAIYRVLLAEGFSLPEIGEILYRAYEAWLCMMPRFLFRLSARMKTGRKGLAGLAAAAAESRERRYTGDWVYDFIDGRSGKMASDEAFDFGVDYHECGILKFLEAEGASELAPYLCLLDFPMCDRGGMGLKRTTTLASGGAVCDFRFKRGRPTPGGWPPPWLAK